MSHNVFISFSSKDIETALRIYEGLSNRGAKCWISARHVSPGGNYQNEIVSALTSSSVMVLIYSHSANTSTEIQKEIALAGQFQLTVIPLKIDDVMPSGGFILNLATSQWVEVFPNFEITLDAVSLQIIAITERIDKFALEVRQALEADGVIEPDDQKYLEDALGVRMGLTVAQSRAIIKRVIGDSARSTSQDRESDYLKLISEVLEDGKITRLEKMRLADRATSLGINDVRAEMLLEQEKSKKGISDNSQPPIADASPGVREPIAKGVDEGEKAAEADEGHKLKVTDTGCSVDKSPESHVITNIAGAGNDFDLGDYDEETPREYFQLGNMTAGQVLDSPESEDLAGYIAFYAIGNEEDTSPVLEQLKKASPSALIKDLVENYADFLDADTVGELSVSAARNWSLSRVINKLIDGVSLVEVQRVLDKTNGNTKVWKAFVEYWPDTEAGDEMPDDLLNWDYYALGDMKAGEVLAHSEVGHLIEGISMFANRSDRTVRKYLLETNPDGFVKDVVKHYQDILDPDVLASMNIATARDMQLGKVIAQVLELNDPAEVQRVLDETNGNTKVWKAFIEYWPDTE